MPKPQPRFNVGNVVTLISGGPAMSVLEVFTTSDSRIFYHLRWFDEMGDIKEVILPECALQKFVFRDDPDEEREPWDVEDN